MLCCAHAVPCCAAGSAADLAATLRRIDGRGYKAYKDIEGRWQMPPTQGAYTLCVDWVQGDPFASPSRCRVVVPAGVAALPPQLISSRTRRTAVCDFLTRSFGAAVAASGGGLLRGAGLPVVASMGQHSTARHAQPAVPAEVPVNGSCAAVLGLCCIPRQLQGALASSCG